MSDSSKPAANQSSKVKQLAEELVERELAAGGGSGGIRYLHVPEPVCAGDIQHDRHRFTL